MERKGVLRIASLSRSPPKDFSLLYKKTIRNEEKLMELKYVIPNMEETFGNLEYAGEGQMEHVGSMVG